MWSKKIIFNKEYKLDNEIIPLGTQATIIADEDRKTLKINNKVFNVTTSQLYNIAQNSDSVTLDRTIEQINSSDCGIKLEKVHPFEYITSKMFETYKRKNQDYGNSFDKTLDEWGLSIAAVRLEDKLNRFKSFVKNGSFKVNDEGVNDTLSDLATYAIMTIMYLNNKITN